MNLILEDNVQKGCFGFRSAIHLHPQEDDKQYQYITIFFENFAKQSATVSYYFNIIEAKGFINKSFNDYNFRIKFYSIKIWCFENITRKNVKDELMID